ncbi:hypothetical protein Emag_005148 [Eimeria magna]
MSLDTPVPAQFAADQPLAASVAFAPTQESVHDDNECCFSESTKGEVVKSRRVHFSAKTWGPIVLSLLLVALLAPLCYNSKISSVEKGVKSRRLAGGEDSDDEELSEFAYLKSLCVAVGAWEPGEGSGKDPRASPALVGEVLASLEEGMAESSSLGMPGTSGDGLVYETLTGFEGTLPAAFFGEPTPFGGDQRLDVEWSSLEGTAHAGVHSMPTETGVDASALQHEELGRKRHRPEDEDKPCSSWKMPKLDWSPGEMFVHPFEASLLPGWVTPPQAAPSDVSQFEIPCTDPLPREVEQHEPETPSSYFPQTSSSVESSTSLHSQPAATASTPETPRSDWDKIHPFVRVPSVLPEQLANHMYNLMLKDISSKAPYGAVNLVGRRFLIWDALYCASLALNVPWAQEAWWKSLAEKAYPQLDVSSYSKNAHTFYVQLIDDMLGALRLFKSGERPDPALIVSIKRRLFCSDFTTYYLRTSSWDDWREDDKHTQ